MIDYYYVTITTSTVTNQGAGLAAEDCQRKLRHSFPPPPETVTMTTVIPTYNVSKKKG